MTLAELIEAAAKGDEHAWGVIVERFEGLIWATTRAHRLAAAEAADVTQTTWMRLLENLDRIRDPERLGAWLATTARHECLRNIRLRARELPAADEAVFDLMTEQPIETELLTRERSDALRRALAGVGERCQALLRMLAAVTPPSYEEIGAALGMPVGAIGPTRARCLDKLRRSPELAGLGRSYGSDS
ncbi:MAG: sigma-70 family RNA polymerase sigma factor [Conexibacteraceae bacterium]|nr:sigma-70 family RNA polymerase sigma factor [Conexibacteraceae bacterium]